MASKKDWPPSLRAFVNSVFAQCTDENRSAVEAELKGLMSVLPCKAYPSLSKQPDSMHSTRTSYGAPIGPVSSCKGAKKAARPVRASLDTVRQPPPTPQAQTKEVGPLADPHACPLEDTGTRPDTSFISPILHPAENEARSKRARRFEHDKHKFQSLKTPAYTPSPQMTPEPEANPDVIDWDKHTIVGTSAVLEKPYLRLTSVPDPANVRPLPVLRQTLDLLKRKWRTEQNYNHICDQFKSMRQDLTVQRIKNDFTVSVYEIHARIALEKGDLGEYNQCQSQLRHLYEHGLQGHPEEFLAYRILYLLHTRNRRDINGLIASITAMERQDPCVQHALDVRHALATCNYHRFFKLFAVAPKMGAYLMDHFLARERINALCIMSRSYLSLPLAFISAELSFESPEEAHAFLLEHSAAVYQATDLAKLKPGEDGRTLDCKAVRAVLSAALQNYTKVDIKWGCSTDLCTV